jgi:hypothetical protein
MFGLPRTRSYPPCRPGGMSSSRDVHHCIAGKGFHMSYSSVISDMVRYLLLTPVAYVSAPLRNQTSNGVLTCTASMHSLSAAWAPGLYPQACPRTHIQPSPATLSSIVHKLAGVRRIAVHRQVRHPFRCLSQRPIRTTFLALIGLN